jgi:hypothetical protein
MKTRDFIQRLGRITSDYILLARGKRRARARQINSEAPALIGWLVSAAWAAAWRPAPASLIFSRAAA